MQRCSTARRVGRLRRLFFDAAPVEALFTRVNAALSMDRLQRLLNCGRSQVEQIVNSGILPEIIERAERGSRASRYVRREDAEKFLRDLFEHARRVETATDGMADIVKAARATGWSLVEIVNALLAGRLSRAEYVDPDSGFLGVVVDPVEVRAALNRSVSEDLVSFEEAAGLLRIKRYGVRKFLGLRSSKGLPYLSETSIKDADGRKINLLSRQEIARFLETHISSVDIAGEVGEHTTTVWAKLAANRIYPVIEADGIGRAFYRREDVAEFLRH